MTATSVLGADKPKDSGSRKKGSHPETLERVLAFVRWVGLAFFVLGSTDVALTWLPMDFGNREWEFATVTASFNGMPVIILGLTLVVAGAALGMRRWWALGGGIVGLGFLAFVLGATGLWATNLPLALGAVEGVVLTGMKKAILKTAVQSVVLPLVFGAVAYFGIKSFRVQQT